MDNEQTKEEETKGFGYYAKEIPTDIAENIKYRLKLRKDCVGSQDARRIAVAKCAADPLYFYHAFCMIFEPRPKRGKNGRQLPMIIPFVAWEHQLPVMRDIYASLGYEDIGLEKSRGEGASWLIVLFAVWDWLFNPMTVIGLVSKDEAAVDTPDDPNSLMWKALFLIENLPEWMVGTKGSGWERDRNRHVIKNLANGSTITGFAATANVGTGGRTKWFGMDELAKFPRPQDRDAMASTQYVTNCRFFVSTPYGADGEYYNLMHATSSMTKLRLHWSTNPTRNRGLYTLKNGRAVAVDPENNPLPADYADMSQEVLDRLERLRQRGFTVDKGVRSPWYDNECDRPGATPQNIAQELDINYGGSAFRIFNDQILEKVNATIQPPTHTGDFDFRTEDLSRIEFGTMPGGPFKLWLPLNSRMQPPFGRYAIGCDICLGLGGTHTSNSTIIAIDIETNEQVLEFAANTIPPTEFADLTIAVAKWLHDAQIGWEHNGGGGSAFTKRVLTRQYPNVYYRTSHTRKKGVKTKEVGWWSSTDSKEILFDGLRADLRTGILVARSRDLALELTKYVRVGGKITNSLSVTATEDSQGANHGDRVIGMAIANMVAKSAPNVSPTSGSLREAMPGTLSARTSEYFEDLKRDRNAWDDRTLFDFAARG